MTTMRTKKNDTNSVTSPFRSIATGVSTLQMDRLTLEMIIQARIRKEFTENRCSEQFMTFMILQQEIKITGSTTCKLTEG